MRVLCASHRRLTEETAGVSDGGGSGAPSPVERVTVIKPSLPFVYATFSTMAYAERARRSLDRRVAGSAPLHGRQITAEFAVERLQMTALPGAQRL